MKLGICVGNGLSIDLQKKYEDKLREFDTYKFFGWEVNTPELNEKFLDNLPKLSKELATKRNYNNDFEIVEELIHKYNSNTNSFDNSLLICEIQHYLAIAFSTYQQKIDKISMKNWQWLKWLTQVKDKLIFCISFNYDLVLERALSYGNIKYRRIGCSNELEGICILKPHGSIDYEITPNTISMPPITYPLKNAVFRNDCGIYSLKEHEYLLPRKEVDIVLPNEYSTQMNYQWVKPGYDAIRNEGGIFTHFAFIGLSYSVFDRPEINYILESLSENTTIIVANPRPNKDFLNTINNKFSKVIIWDNGPQFDYKF